MNKNPLCQGDSIALGSVQLSMSNCGFCYRLTSPRNGLQIVPPVPALLILLGKEVNALYFME